MKSKKRLSNKVRLSSIHSICCLGDCFAARPIFPLPTIGQYSTNGGVLFATGESWRVQRRFSLHTLRDFGMGRNVMEHKINSTIRTMLDYLDKSGMY
jgi:hypothetical protein